MFIIKDITDEGWSGVLSINQGDLSDRVRGSTQTGELQSAKPEGG